MGLKPFNIKWKEGATWQLQFTFVKATYDDNVYKLSDFYTGTSYKQNANKSMNVDMAFNDGPTTLDTQIRILPDATDIRDHTHIIVPSKKKDLPYW